MGLFKKFSDLVRSNLNNWLDQAENPQKLADLAILEAEETKKKAYNLLIKAQAAKNSCAVKLESEENPGLKTQIEQEKATHEETINIIKRGLKALDNQISLLKSKAATNTEHVSDSSAFDTFARMENKIEASEAEIEALKELFIETEQASKKSSLEDELEALKKKLGGG